jgi:hypothetical protein
MIELKRKDLWLSDYHDLIDEIRREPFDWKGRECVLGLGARTVFTLTGEQLGAEYADRFDDAASAYRLMRELGFSDLADLVAFYLPEYAHPSEAQIGDIVTIPVETQFKHGLGVMNGERIITMTEGGIGTIDRLVADRAFRVG